MMHTKYKLKMLTKTAITSNFHRLQRLTNKNENRAVAQNNTLVNPVFCSHCMHPSVKQATTSKEFSTSEFDTQNNKTRYFVVSALNEEQENIIHKTENSEVCCAKMRERR